jgi:hypothetical protein
VIDLIGTAFPVIQADFLFVFYDHLLLCKVS